jgi:hypothetical protein
MFSFKTIHLKWSNEEGSKKKKKYFYTADLIVKLQFYSTIQQFVVLRLHLSSFKNYYFSKRSNFTENKFELIAKSKQI